LSKQRSEATICRPHPIRRPVFGSMPSSLGPRVTWTIRGSSGGLQNPSAQCTVSALNGKDFFNI